jgi:hypothetical protein
VCKALSLFGQTARIVSPSDGAEASSSATQAASTMSRSWSSEPLDWSRTGMSQGPFKNSAMKSAERPARLAEPTAKQSEANASRGS